MDWKTVLGFTILFHVVVYATRKSWILRLDTKKLNKCINGLSTNRIRKYFRIWFRLGSYVTICIGFPFTLWLFLQTIFYTLLPSVATVALAVTPSSFLSSTTEEPLELHREELSPYPDAEIPIEVSAPASAESAAHSSYLAVQPILPGWNLPMTHLPYYLVAILISVVIHELGHAVASASHRIPILSMGVSLFGPLIPAAHVELNTTQLREAPLRKQLDILTAGVWMNIYLSLIAYFVVPWLLPAVLFPTHSLGGGIAVTGVISSSGAGGPGGLERGDIIFGVENCAVKDLDSWLTCLESIWGADPVGYCLDPETVAKYLNQSENPGCCGADKDTSPTHLCFLQMTAVSETLKEKENQQKLELEQASTPSGNGTLSTIIPAQNASDNSSTSYCLPAKPIIMLNESTTNKCYSPHYTCPNLPKKLTSDVDEGQSDKGQSDKGQSDTDTVDEHPHAAENESEVHAISALKKDGQDDKSQSHCYIARLLEQYHSFRIIQIHRRQGSVKESVLFVGDVWDLRNGVQSTDYVPRSWWLVEVLSFSLFAKIPVHLETVLLLTAGLSAGLAVVNMLPIYGLDGYHVVEAMAHLSLGTAWESRKISRLVTYISWTAVTMALLTIVCSLVQNF